MKKYSGAAVLSFVIILLFSLTLLMFSLTKMGIFSQKITANEYRAQQAKEAAEAGLDFGIVYLAKNSATIVKDINSDGYIDAFSNSSTTNVSLSNGSKYSITYNNPTANNLNIITITSIGSSSDNSASRELRVKVKYTPVLMSYSNYPFLVRGNVSLSGSSQVSNTESNNNVQAGGTISISGGARTITSSGTTSTSSSTQSDVSQNNAGLQSSTATSFFMSSFGVAASTIANSVNYYYQNSSNTNYNTKLSGKEGVSIWIDQTGGTTATVDSTTVVGSATNPVILIVNGDLKIQGSAVIYGFIFITGNLQTAGSATVNGGVAVGGNVTDSGNFTLNYSSAILSKVQQSMGSYGKIAGSWNDFKQ